MTTVSIANLRNNLASIVNKIARKKDRYVVEKANIPVGILINYDEYKELIEQLEDLALSCNPDVLERIQKSKEDYRRGRVKSFEDFAKELGL